MTQELCSLVENKIKDVCRGLFLEGKLKVYEQKIPINTVVGKLLAKMRAENLQGQYLQARLEIVKRHPDEIYEKVMEVLEKLFRKRGCYAHAYVCCLMIVLKQRTSLGLPNIELYYIKRALKLYKRVSKREHRSDLKLFTPIFSTILNEAGKISLHCYIFVKMQLYLAYFHKYHGDPELAIAQMIVYLNYRLEYGMYARTEELIAECLLCTNECVAYNHLDQAIHLLNGIRALLDRLDGTDSQMRFQKVVLLEFTLIITAMILIQNIVAYRGYHNTALNQHERNQFIPKKNVTKLKLEIEDYVQIDLVSMNDPEIAITGLKAKLCQYKKLLTEPLIADLAKVFGKMMVFLEQSEKNAGIIKMET